MVEGQENYLRFFRMPTPVRITGRTSSITNSFINGIIPVVAPTNDEVGEALSLLDMLEQVACAYCGDPHTEWDHLRPLVIGKQPTGYISEIHNLVPACGKCNQSKGNKNWREWMFSGAPLSPRTRAKSGLTRRAERLAAYEAWMRPTRLDFEELVGADVWALHWHNYERLIALMKSAEETASLIRNTVKANYLLGRESQPTSESGAPS